ncbi:MAG: FecR domain-containing protein [Geminicoccaceae bacterium]|nr:FecR domain-containing protein [Geminicoccaceae bacterium]
MLVVFLLWAAPISATAQETAKVDPSLWLYEVKPGDNIWTISRRLLVDWHRWPDVQERNHITQPRAIPPGTVIGIPRDWLRRRPGPATISALSGTAFADGPEGRHPLEAGASVDAGEMIETGDQSSVQLTFVDGSTVSIYEKSRVVLQKLDTFEGTRSADVLIRLESGRLDAKVVKEQDRDSRFNFQSPALISAIRGTQIRTGMVGGKDRGTTEVLAGTVHVEAAGLAASVDKGFGTAANVGQAAEPPSPLLPAPVPVTGDTPVRSLPVRLTVVPVQGAVRYHVIVASSDSPAAALLDLVSDEPFVDAANLRDGSYLVRARGEPGRHRGIRCPMDRRRRCPSGGSGPHPAHAGLDDPDRSDTSGMGATGGWDDLSRAGFGHA